MMIRAVALCAQFASLYIIIEFSEKSNATTFFAQLAIALLASRAATLAMPLYAYPLVEKGRTEMALAMALQVQLATFIPVLAVLVPMYLVWALPLWSGIALYLAALLDMNHIFFRHILVARNADPRRIVVYEASQPVFFCTLLLLGHAMPGPGLLLIVTAYALAMIGMCAVGSMSSAGAVNWPNALGRVTTFNARHRRQLRFHALRSLPVSLDQFIGMAVGNFPIYAATVLGRPLDVISMALLQRLIAVVEAFSWLDVVHSLNVYYVQKQPQLRIRLTLAVAVAIAALSYAASWLPHVSSIDSIGNAWLPNLYFHLVRLADVPGIFLLPGLAFLMMHLHSAYLGSRKFAELLNVGLISLAVLVAVFALSVGLQPASAFTAECLSTAVFAVAFILLTAFIFPAALGLAPSSTDREPNAPSTILR